MQPLVGCVEQNTLMGFTGWSPQKWTQVPGKGQWKQMSVIELAQGIGINGTGDEEGPWKGTDLIPVCWQCIATQQMKNAMVVVADRKSRG